jgi:hypothetical protein
VLRQELLRGLLRGRRAGPLPGGPGQQVPRAALLPGGPGQQVPLAALLPDGQELA